MKNTRTRNLYRLPSLSQRIAEAGVKAGNGAVLLLGDLAQVNLGPDSGEGRILSTSDGYVSVRMGTGTKAGQTVTVSPNNIRPLGTTSPETIGPPEA